VCLRAVVLGRVAVQVTEPYGNPCYTVWNFDSGQTFAQTYLKLFTNDAGVSAHIIALSRTFSLSLALSRSRSFFLSFSLSLSLSRSLARSLPLSRSLFFSVALSPLREPSSSSREDVGLKLLLLRLHTEFTGVTCRLAACQCLLVKIPPEMRHEFKSWTRPLWSVLTPPSP
jgi:hypothetical protein